MSVTGTESAGEPIEDYLDALLLRLHLPPRETRRLLAETEAHLRETAADLQAHGMPAQAAEREAVRRFGPAGEIAAAAGAGRRPAAATLVAHASWAVLALAGAGLLAVGLSGALAALFNAVAGPRFVGALPRTYPMATCHYYLAAHPGSGSCAQAAMWETSQDAVSLRALAGALGLLALAAGWLWHRRLSGDPALADLRDGTVGALAGLAFAAAAVFLTGTGVDVAVQHGSGGVGFYLTGAIVAAPAALLAGLWSYRRLRLLRPWRLVDVPA